MNIRQYISILRKRFGWFAALFIFVIVSALIAVSLIQPVYEATNKIFLQEKDSSLSAIGQELAGLSSLAALSRTGNPLDTQSEILKSAPVVQRVVDKFNLLNRDKSKKLSVDEFLEKAKVVVIKDTDIIEISYQDHDAKLAMDVANFWGATYVDDNRAVNRAQAVSAAEFISKQLSSSKQELEKSESDLKEFKERNQAIDLSRQSSEAVQALAELETQERQTTTALGEAKSRLKTLHQQVGLGSREAMALTAVAQSPTIQKLKLQLLEAETDPLVSSSFETKQNPIVERAQLQIESLKSRLDEEIRKTIGQYEQSNKSVAEMDPIRQELTRELVKTELEFNGLSTRKDLLGSIKTEYEHRLESLPAKELELTQLRRRSTVSGEIYRLLSQKYEETKIQEASNIGNARIVEQAINPDKPIFPKKPPIIGGATLLGLLLGLWLALLVDTLDNRVHLVSEVLELVKIPILGVIAQYPGKKSNLIVLEQPNSPISESYRSIRTNLRFLAADFPLTAFTITSCAPKEGKSLTLSNLAITYAKMGRSVLLVDTDLRKPSLHRVFGVENNAGVTSILVGDQSFESVVKQTKIEGLSILSSGAIPPNPTDLLESSRFTELISEVRERFDLVLFDAPPISVAPDASLLASKLDGFVFTVRMGVASRQAILNSLDLLNKQGCRSLGLVLNGITSGLEDQYSYYAGYYGEEPQSTLWTRIRAGLRVGKSHKE